MAELLIGLLAIWLVIYIFVLLPMKMAKTRERSPFGWVLISLLFSPLVAIIGLLVLGHSLPEQNV